MIRSIGSISTLGMAIALAGSLVLVPAGAGAQELSTRLTGAAMTPHRWTPRPVEVEAAPHNLAVPIRSAPAADDADAGFRIGVGDVLLAIGGALVVGSLTDYVADAPHWSLTATQAGVFGSGALMAVVGGLRVGEPQPAPSGGRGSPSS